MQDEDRQFEADVRRIAESLWPSDELGGATKLRGSERDGFYVTQDVVNLVEATTSRRKDKADNDITKIVKALPELKKKYPDKSVKGWFITRDQPTADQLDVARKYRGDVMAESFERFRARLLDATSYLKLRGQFVFGSAQDPDTSSRTNLPAYVPLDLLQLGEQEVWSVQRIVSYCHSGGRLIMLGDFGAGKSMTMRELFLTLRTDFHKTQAKRTPIHLNLRDHHGQAEPAEALERHARLLGFPNPHHLVRAWRSGEVDLLLDGFDELGSPGWVGSTKRMAAVRHSAAALVRNFVQQAPRGSAVVVAGRQHFFDSIQELRTALGLSPDFQLLTLNEFSEEQIGAYLRRRNIEGPVPAWLPGRPLLVAYLAAKGFLADVVATGLGTSPAESWDRLLDRICEREAAVDINLDGPTVRLVIERLATTVRSTSDGLGPISFDDLTRAFNDVCGYPPDDKGMVLLQRLPGLGLRDEQMNTRQFIDENLADTARAGDVCAFLTSPFSFEHRDPATWGVALGTLGVDMVVARIQSGTIPSANCGVGLEECQRNGWMTLAADVSRIAVEGRVSLAGLHRIFIRDVDIAVLELDEGPEDFSALEFQDSIIRRLEVDRDSEGGQLPTFRRCLFGLVDGRVGKSDLPSGKFIDCEFDQFGESTSTTAGIMELSLSPAARVALTILKKLYLQRGSGRKEAALFRGLDFESRRLVPEVLRLIERHGLVVRSKGGSTPIYLPVRSDGPRVRKMLAAPTTSDDALLVQCREL